MSHTVTLPDGFIYVGPALMTTVWLLVGQIVIVGRYRRRAGIEYPQMYAEKAQAAASRDAHLFNCAQRTHQNTLEYLPLIYTTTIISGLRFPLFAACTCAYWSMSRISYTRGYLSGNPDGRNTGFHGLSYLAVISLILTSSYVSGSWVLTNILGS